MVSATSRPHSEPQLSYTLLLASNRCCCDHGPGCLAAATCICRRGPGVSRSQLRLAHGKNLRSLSHESIENVYLGLVWCFVILQFCLIFGDYQDAACLLCFQLSRGIVCQTSSHKSAYSLSRNPNLKFNQYRNNRRCWSKPSSLAQSPFRGSGDLVSRVISKATIAISTRNPNQGA